jgi:hypothetical protein
VEPPTTHLAAHRLRRAAVERAIPPAPSSLESLRVVADGPTAGVSRKHVLEDPAGRRFFWKVPARGSLAFERTLLANELRAQTGEPVVPLVRHVLDDGGTRVEGMLSPLVPHAGNLDYRSATYSPAEIDAVLGDMPWAFFLGNWDTKPDQYLRVGGAAVNVDWDQTLSDFGTGRRGFDRHTTAHFSPLVPPAQAAVLLDWVHGDVGNGLESMLDSARRIAALSDDDLAHAAAPLITALASGQAAASARLPAAEDVLPELRQRRDRVVHETEQLVALLTRERKRNGGAWRALDVRLFAAGVRDVGLRTAIAVGSSPILDALYAARRRLAAEESAEQLPSRWPH